jgi:hypothetical protein
LPSYISSKLPDIIKKAPAWAAAFIFHENMKKKEQELLFEVLEPLLLNNHFHAYLVSNERKCEFISLWKKHFAPNVLSKNEALWHTFSFDHYPHSFGSDAIRILNKTWLKDIMIFSTHHFYAIECSALFPVFLDYVEFCRYLSQITNHVDIYIAQKNYKWTFVIPHEKDFGPYYADLSIRSS